MTPTSSFIDIPDGQLLLELKDLAANEREATAALIACLAEVDARRLYLGEGCSSLFTYCTQVLHLSEHAAYGRIEAARAARRFPVIRDELASGTLTLTAICLLGPHLTDENHAGLLTTARHRSKRDLERLVAAIRPKPDVPSAVRKVPQPVAAVAAVLTTAACEDAAASPVRMPAEQARGSVSGNAQREPQARRAIVAPLAPERYKVQFTIDRETHDKLRCAQDLLRHAVPNGDVSEVFDRALTLLIEHLQKTRCASAKRSRASRPAAEGSRRIPANVRRAVWKRDAGQCAFRGAEGRCGERGFLEFHHVVPYARGGAAMADNIELRCRAHNQYEAEMAFGRQRFLIREHREFYDAFNSARTEFVRRRPDISLFEATLRDSSTDSAAWPDTRE